MGTGDYELLWGEVSRPSRGRPAGLSRERIVAEARAIADAEGLQKVSMKHLAERLGSGVMSLYRHVPGKDELVLLMYDSLMTGPPPIPEADHWREILRGWGQGVRGLFNTHPWALSVATSERSMGPGEATWVDAVIGRLTAVGMPIELALISVLTVDCFVMGAVRPELAGDSGEAEFFQFLADPAMRARFPNLALLTQPGAATDVAMGDHFEFGLERVLDGLERHIETSA
ncbi:TetR/AcrR family transcriptional regulator [Glycomyces algeriensis]|uniref:TetR family transcriptional regulator n=1 Tax=Glycomyces algeriensis TaxID=256037 RepID=A0A9W6LF07_9ACTN|nr:TetR/AcrR family transcriptional regulator [Glycomyces algeriensis]MDA1367173.1 TetR/AcrR family transcriptional regulator [Glycomyces algeriensis]MDR7353444.1 AcrR family transcriptional regulator [Glycomyces algeriensis]GLI41143.1 TetR family transcriptional regulator [Glycomyces algeriensis]